MNGELVATFTVQGEPVSKSRARFTKRGSKTYAYTPEKTHAAEAVMAWTFRTAAPHHAVDADSAFGVSCDFFFTHRQRRDVDNMVKLICDGLNGIAWADDNQVFEVAARKTPVAKGGARTEVSIYRLGPIGRPTAPCQNCGADMDIYSSTKDVRKYCSQACHLEFRRKARATECAHCAHPTDGAKFCSVDCRRAASSETRACSECGQNFEAWKSLGERKNVWCSDACTQAHRQRRAVECVNGHPWATFERIKPTGKRYCAECNRLRAVRRKASA